jgi:cyclopropane fatty-acyl-phospholipid synthase-like methyltransferase
MGVYEHKSESSKPFAYFWESLTDKKQAKERAKYIQKPISRYFRSAKKILEIGCGIGEVLVNLPDKYEISGLDIEKDYIEGCRKRIPRGNFYVSSMHNFKIGKKFDVIFSANDAINFLNNFSQWKATFKAVKEHLEANGLFIFDVYIPKKLRTDLNWLKKHRKSTSSVREFPQGYYYDIELIKGNTLTWDSRIFEKLPNGLYQLNMYKFTERIYPVAKVKSALSKHFEIVQANPREGGTKILFVCRMK